MQSQMKKLTLFLFLLKGFLEANCQLPYTVQKYGFDSIRNINYGVVQGYDGFNDSLFMDIYRPKNDSNCKRPIAILIHGGAWIGGWKDDPALKWIAEKMAKRGWVVASVSYRLGTHKAKNYDMYAFCNNGVSEPCAYICDSSEVYRANYRAVQDVKGAIRFLKQRHQLDSTDIDNIFLIGFSAGGFIAMHTAFSDTSAKKPLDCFAITDAPSPSSNLAPYNCNANNFQLTRPDLGDIEGSLHLGMYDSKAKGAASFYGGILNTNMLRITGDTPSIYLYHQGSDVVVNYKHGALLGRISNECFGGTNLCQPYYFYPKALGGESLRQLFADSSYIGSNYKAEIVNNYVYNGNCFSNGHSVDNMAARTDSMIGFFASRVNRDGNVPTHKCHSNSLPIIPIIEFHVFPNPFESSFRVAFPDHLNQAEYFILDAIGREVLKGSVSQQHPYIDLHHLEDGMYLLVFKSNGEQFKIIKEN